MGQTTDKVCPVGSLLGSCDLWALVERTIPHQPKQRHGLVFRLARVLRGHPETANKPLDELRSLVYRWYDTLVARVGADNVAATADENWGDFAEGWGKVKHPWRANFMEALFERVKRQPLPKAADRYRTDAFRLVVGLCAELQRENGDRPFPLACTVVARLLGYGEGRVASVRAHRLLKGLVIDGVLSMVERGQLRGRRANTYRYLGD